MADHVQHTGKETAPPLWNTWLIILLLFVYIPHILSQEYWNHSYIKGDSYYYRAVIISLLEDGDLLLANNVNSDPLNGQLALRWSPDGKEELVPKHPILLSLVALPFYALFGSSGLLLFNIAMSLILMIMLLQLNKLFLEPVVAWGTTLLYGVATLLLDYIYNFSPDIFSTALILTGVYTLFQGRLKYAAILLALSIFAKPMNLIPVGVIGLYFLSNQINWTKQLQINWRNIAVFVICFTIGILPFFTINYILYGSPLVTGYQRIAIPGDISGEASIATHTNDFNQPILAGLYFVMFYANKGLLTTNPLLVLAFPAMLQIMQMPRRKELLLLISVSVALLLFIAKYDYWYLSHFSNRFLMVAVVFSAPFTGWTITQIVEKYGGKNIFTKTLLL